MSTEPEITQDLIESHGLNAEEYDRLTDIIGRIPTYTELGIFSAMWNEHCSYKSSKKMVENTTYYRTSSDLWSRVKMPALLT